MIECSECGVYFFTQDGRNEHDKLCIGYRPKNEGVSIKAEWRGLLKSLAFYYDFGVWL